MCRETFIQDAYKIPHTATIPTFTTSGPPPQATRRPGTAPIRQSRATLPASPQDDYENTVAEQARIDAHMARLRRGASSRRNALESLDGGLFNSGPSHDDHAVHGSSKSRATGRPATAGSRPHVTHGPALSVRARPALGMQHFSGHDTGGHECEQEEFRFRPDRHRPRPSSPERPRLRPQVNLNSSYLAGRSCLSGQARKIDRCVCLP